MANSARYLDKIFTSASKQTVEYVKGYSADIYIPDNDTVKARPFVICMAGGGGDKSDGGTVIWAQQEWALRGYVGIAANYKTLDDHFTEEHQKESVLNIWNLLVFLQKNADKYGLSKRKVFIMGTSAGGITAVQSSIALNDRNDPYFGGFIDPTVKLKIKATATISGAATPVYIDFIDKADAPNFAYHGEKDTTVDYKQAVETKDKMVEAGIPSTLMSFKDADHTIGHGDEIKADLIPKFWSIVLSS